MKFTVERASGKSVEYPGITDEISWHEITNTGYYIQCIELNTLEEFLNFCKYFTKNNITGVIVQENDHLIIYDDYIE